MGTMKIDYYTDNVTNGTLFKNEGGECGEEIGNLKNGVPFFY